MDLFNEELNIPLGSAATERPWRNERICAELRSRPRRVFFVFVSEGSDGVPSSNDCKSGAESVCIAIESISTSHLCDSHTSAIEVKKK